MGRFRTCWITLRFASGLLAAFPLTLGLSGATAADTPSGASEPSFIGTWHVLIHYQVPDGPHPDRWKWDERVWIIEPADEGLEWVEHAIVHFEDQTGRFENLGTPAERRLIGAWEPSDVQRQQVETGLVVSSRGMRRKHLSLIEPGHWRSSPRGNDIGRSSSGIAYTEVWSIREEDNGTRFEIDSRFAVSASAADESGGVTSYVADEAGTSRFQGVFDRSGERHGRFRADATRIVVPQVRERSILFRGIPTPMGIIQLIPDQNANNRVPLLFTILRPFHYYSERKLLIDSTPPGAELDLAYLRRGSQLMYRRGRAPLEVVLPTRLQSAPADRLLIRGFLPGHERTRRSVSVSEVDEKLHLELPPLPNQVVGIAHGSLAGRSVLELRSEEIPTVRIAEDAGGWTVVLVRTGLPADLTDQVTQLRDPMLGIEARQLGDDLVVRLSVANTQALDLRHRSLTDPARGESRTRIEIDGPQAQGRADRLRVTVGEMTELPDDDCGGRYERALREELTERELATRLGRDDHPYRATLRAALRQLAQVSPDGTLHTTTGASLSPHTPLEFELAWSQSADIEGYLTWLHELALRINPTDDGALAFRSLVAPDWSTARFDQLLASAASARGECPAKEPPGRS